MIYLNLNIRNPNWWSRFENVKSWAGVTPIKHKCWEVQVIKNDNWLRFEFGVTTRQDHAGCNLELGLFGWETHFTFYDNRHWNYEKCRWMLYNEEEGWH